jgi:hypothetical protein
VADRLLVPVKEICATLKKVLEEDDVLALVPMQLGAKQLAATPKKSEEVLERPPPCVVWAPPSRCVVSDPPQAIPATQTGTTPANAVRKATLGTK